MLMIKLLKCEIKISDTKIDGITVQRMIREKDSLKLILGTKKTLSSELS